MVQKEGDEEEEEKRERISIFLFLLVPFSVIVNSSENKKKILKLASEFTSSISLYLFE